MCFNCSDSSCSYIPHHLVREAPSIRWWAGFSFKRLFIQWANPVHSHSDPNADPDHTGSGRRHWSGEIWKATTPVVNSTKCARKCPLNFQSNLRDQEARGSNPRTPTKNPLIFVIIRGFSLVYCLIFLPEFYVFLF